MFLEGKYICTIIIYKINIYLIFFLFFNIIYNFIPCAKHVCDALKFLQIAISLTYFLFITCILNYITNISDEYFYNVQKLCTFFVPCFNYYKIINYRIIHCFNTCAYVKYYYIVHFKLITV